MTCIAIELSSNETESSEELCCNRKLRAQVLRVPAAGHFFQHTHTNNLFLWLIKNTIKISMWNYQKMQKGNRHYKPRIFIRRYSRHPKSVASALTQPTTTNPVTSCAATGSAQSGWNWINLRIQTAIAFAYICTLKATSRAGHMNICVFKCI